MTATRRRARFLLGLGTLFGLAYLGYWTLAVGSGAGINFEVYRGAAAALRAGDPVYGVSLVGDPAYTFRYPPVALAPLSAFLLLDSLAGYLLHVVGTLTAGIALGVLLVRVVERHGLALERIDLVLVTSFVTVGPIAAPSLLYGNVNHHVALAVALGLLWLDRGREAGAGVAVGAAALLKVFPAGLGVWFAHRRAWRGLAAALATGLGGLALGVALFGVERTRAFVDMALLSRATPDAFAGGVAPSSEYVSLLRPLATLAPSSGQATLTVVAVALLAPVVGFLYRRDDGGLSRLCALYATGAAILLVLPSFSLYYLVLAYPFVPLLYCLPGRAGTVFAAGAAIHLFALKLPDVDRLLAPLPAAIEGPGVAAATAFYAVGTPVLLGTLVMLGACVLYTRRVG